MTQNRLTVGSPSCDFAGFTNRDIQSAIDRVAAAGGGEVELSAGTFALADSVHLRSGVRLLGAGEATVLRKNPMKSAAVACYLGYGHYDIIVDRPGAFELGDGIYLHGEHAGGFHATVGTLVAYEDNTWFTNRPHSTDYTVRDKAFARTLFPLVEATDVSDASAEGLALDGNAAENPVMINGCRGGGAYAIRSARVAFRNLLIRDCNCEGISFQTCDDLEVADCRIERCAGNGLHPGSGSNRFHVHGCRVLRCGACGLFYCLRVRDSVLEDCVFEECGSHGVSIGSRDTGHVNRRLTIRGCGGAGVFIRRCSRADGAHDNLVENCKLEENCAAGVPRGEGVSPLRREGILPSHVSSSSSSSSSGEAEIVVQGETVGTQIVSCSIRRRPGKPGILVQPEVISFHSKGNDIAPPGADSVVDRRGEPIDFEPGF